MEQGEVRSTFTDVIGSKAIADLDFVGVALRGPTQRKSPTAEEEQARPRRATPASEDTRR